MTEPTSASPVQRLTLDLRVRRLQVVGTADLSACLRRIVLGGPDAADFACFGPTDHAKVLFPTEPDGALVLGQVEDRRLVDPPDAAYVARDYTIRTHEPTSGTVVIDMAVHEHGPAGRWASRARPGDELGLLGPKTSKLPPMDRDWYLLAADEAGLPAVTNWLERLTAAGTGARVQAYVEVDGPEAEVALPSGDGVEVTWVHRGGAAAGTTTLLAEAVAQASWGQPDDGPGWVFAGAEATAVRALRGVVADRGVDRASTSMTGYWRVGVANFDHKSPEAQG